MIVFAASYGFFPFFSSASVFGYIQWRHSVKEEEKNYNEKKYHMENALAFFLVALFAILRTHTPTESSRKKQRLRSLPYTKMVAANWLILHRTSLTGFSRARSTIAASTK